MTQSHRTLESRSTARWPSALRRSPSGCHKKHQHRRPPPWPRCTRQPSAAAHRDAITADPLAIDLGQSVVLNWRTTNATSVIIDGIGQVAVNGTQTVSPANSTNFHLVAKGDGGTTEANVRVTVRVPAAPTQHRLTPATARRHGLRRRLPRRRAGHLLRLRQLRPPPRRRQPRISAPPRYLTLIPAIKVLIGGYCDDRGSAEYNITLGENRANAAKTALVSAGVAADRIRVVSYGKEKPVLHRRNRELLAAEPPRPVHHRPLSSSFTQAASL